MIKPRQIVIAVAVLGAVVIVAAFAFPSISSGVTGTIGGIGAAIVAAGAALVAGKKSGTGKVQKPEVKKNAAQTVEQKTKSEILSASASAVVGTLDDDTRGRITTAESDAISAGIAAGLAAGESIAHDIRTVQSNGDGKDTDGGVQGGS